MEFPRYTLAGWKSTFEVSHEDCVRLSQGSNFKKLKNNLFWRVLMRKLATERTTHERL